MMASSKDVCRSLLVFVGIYCLVASTEPIGDAIVAGPNLNSVPSPEDASPSLPRPIDQSVEGINGFSSEKPLEKRSVRSLTSSTGMERDQRLFWKVTWLVKTVNGISNAVKKG
ncbi:uncharacterized protein LOC116932996 isoform X2 [Daphnia magna]|uniref:uncharacterized protein LOC116932996 isoform X2 n=1 Tax=Daphnia magna TaxID=35525 RepID=UPI001E1BBC31|nr:uncharacterized protein LOC116932996 isoform X2 [Daphnia magna]